MATTSTIKKLIVLALYTSPVISALIITPLFITGNVKAYSYVEALLFITGLVLFFWAVNITVYAVATNAKGTSAPLRYLLSYVFGVVLSVFIVSWFFEGSFHNASHQDFFHFHLLVFIAINTAVIILQNLTLVREKNAMVEAENMQLRIKNIEAANQQLKHQVQPHFLFNSLSTLKALIKTSPAQAEEYLVRLSDFLRYAVSASRPDKVKIEDEVKLCIDYLEMQKIRFGEALQFTIDIPAEVQLNKYMPVFALQMLTENAIKHNMLTIAMPLIINIAYTDNTIAVSNNLQQRDTINTETGMGLNNLSERYKLLSGDDIAIQKDDNTFKVTIKVLP